MEIPRFRESLTFRTGYSVLTEGTVQGAFIDPRNQRTFLVVFTPHGVMYHVDTETLTKDKPGPSMSKDGPG